MTYTNEQLARCAHREVSLRKAVYPRQVYKGNMSQAKADAEIAMMQQIAAHFETLAKQEELPL